MGNSSSAISPRVNSNNANPKSVDLEELVRITHCIASFLPEFFFVYLLDEMHELNQMHNQWKRETPNGEIHRRDFKDFLINIGIEDPVIHDLIFNAFLGNLRQTKE